MGLAIVAFGIFPQAYAKTADEINASVNQTMSRYYNQSLP
jgi:hypothetical protein